MTSKAKSTSKLSQQTVAILGLGKIGSILLQAMLREGLLSPKRVRATVNHADKTAKLTQEFGIQVGTDNAAAIKGADIILVALKPQQIGTVLTSLRDEIKPNQLLISVAASVPTAYMEERLAAKVPIIRAMPNTPSMLGAGMTGICKGAHATAAQLDLAQAMFNTVGRTAIVEEKHMDAVTGLSASGPAFIYIIIESLAEAGVKVGLPRDLATLLAAQTTMGAAQVVLETGQHPAQLKDAVTTPAGCTIDGILELEEGKLRVTLIKAVVKAAQRAKELVFS
ncbi:pyrroline-5-carboxylate reductase [Candidatus Koribacter versatilis Ellin345]|uniref:Pyrroline-5-carboxylate reductase n=1 Tax=Koribacter versatilis (strain Ellin345) TaxID=204669 RepID=Q1IRM0_KORVE|nr:pyrroline-5-carboxylate reductase [Candidatus Koribacter versatilis]ABF40480.1 pyrroline-5-carboxylate reductase [Candidatus Koribacter versatilis Ellin345]